MSIKRTRKPFADLMHEVLVDELNKRNSSLHGFYQKVCRDQPNINRTTLVHFLHKKHTNYNTKTIEAFLDALNLSIVDVIERYGEWNVYCKLKVDQFHGILPLKKGPLVFFILWVMK